MATNLVKALAMSAALTSTLTVLSTTANAEYQLIDRVVAIVEDDIVLASDIRDQIVAIKKRITASGGQMPADDVLFEQVLERSILENLQLQRA
ncbi:MAG TPA: molecular chaperone SurA, partial [Cellvibrionales bacterium]|nr:molecular chaperone SurA [Cellvibrionales bacterium]